MRFHTLVALFAVASSALAAPSPGADAGSGAVSDTLEQFDKRAPTINHDALWPMTESVRSGPQGNAIRRYEPFLHIASGCQSYIAVNANGQVSGGLDNTGGSTSGCNDNRRGQTYARGIWHRGRYAIMYAWYFPKDQITDGGGNFGHRHDWENVVIWIDNPANANPHVFGAAASGHGSYKKTTAPQMRNGNHLQVEYMTNFPTNHELQFKTSPGRDLSMVDWDTLPGPARTALNTHNFGKATVPFKDDKDTFTANLDKAWI